MSNPTCVKCSYPLTESGKCRVIGCLAAHDAWIAERDEARAAIEKAVGIIQDEDDPDAPGRPWLVSNVLGVLRAGLTTDRT